MSKLVLYYNDGSQAARATMLTIAALGLEVEMIYVDLVKREQLKPEFVKINPLHTIPTLVDGDFVIWDSHVINAYLVQKYGKDDSLYPKDLQKRSIVDQRNFFECGVLFPRMGAAVFPIFYHGAKEINKEAAAMLEPAYSNLEALLEGNTYVAGNQLTIADFSIVATLTSLNAVVPIAENRYPKISAWISRIKALPYYEQNNQIGVDKFTEQLKKGLKLVSKQ